MQEDASTLPQLQARSNPGDPNASVMELRDVSGLLVIACVFAMAGGYMDAYAYLAHLPGTRSCLRKCADWKRGPLLSVCVWGPVGASGATSAAHCGFRSGSSGCQAAWCAAREWG